MLPCELVRGVGLGTCLALSLEGVEELKLPCIANALLLETSGRVRVRPEKLKLTVHLVEDGYVGGVRVSSGELQRVEEGTLSARHIATYEALPTDVRLPLLLRR